jgi:uncharacterized damage-inducible protein DinB
MITAAYAKTMARYNQWQNQSLYGAAATLTEAERRDHRGAFFGSIHATLNHLVWADMRWMQRFAGTPAPSVSTIEDSVALYPHWADLAAARVAFDDTIVAWANGLDQTWLDGTLTWRPASQSHDLMKPRALCVIHMFNHQTHHRGQIHAMLTAAGAQPADTDIVFMPRA